MAQPLSMLRFSTPAARCGVQFDCEPQRSTIAARNALLRMLQHRRDWRACCLTLASELNLARKENDPQAPRAPFLTHPLCDLPSMSTSSSRSRTTMADPSRTQRSIRSNTSSASSSAASRAACSRSSPSTALAPACFGLPHRIREGHRGRDSLLGPPKEARRASTARNPRCSRIHHGRLGCDGWGARRRSGYGDGAVEALPPEDRPTETDDRVLGRWHPRSRARAHGRSAPDPCNGSRHRRSAELSARRRAPASENDGPRTDRGPLGAIRTVFVDHMSAAFPDRNGSVSARWRSRSANAVSILSSSHQILEWFATSGWVRRRATPP